MKEQRVLKHFVKERATQLATQVVKMILKIDDVIEPRLNDFMI